MSLKSHFPCKKMRRSPRLEMKELVETKEKTVQVGPLGYFELLPVEIQYHVFSYLSIENLSHLTLTSKAMRNLVELYRSSKSGIRRLLPICPNYPGIHVQNMMDMTVDQQAYCLRQFYRLGLLMKRTTCLYATRERLKVIQDSFLSRLLCYKYHCKDMVKCISLLCYGTFLNTVIAGWDDMECQRVFEFIMKTSNMQQNIERVLKLKQGACPGVELCIRLFCRRAILDVQMKKEDKAQWLSRILKPLPIVHRAKILFIIYGPFYDNEIEWYTPCESVPMNAGQSQQQYGGLAGALTLLHQYHPDWTEDDIISLIDEITSLPDDWLPENLAQLLTLCGDSITLKLIGSKAINGRMADIASIITSLCLVCAKNHYNTSWVVYLLQVTCQVIDNARDRLSLLNDISDTFRDNIIEIHEYSNSDDRDAELDHLVTAQAEFMKEIMTLAFQNMLHGMKEKSIINKGDFNNNSLEIEA